MSNSYSRRDFVGDSTKLAVGALIVPRHMLGASIKRAPGAKLNIACVGIGGMGMNNMAMMTGENIVAVCDVDFPYVERGIWGRMHPAKGEPTASAIALSDAYTKAAKYNDFRVMLDTQRDIDAVLVATPDHMHATIAYRAMSLKKHVYVQKPLTYSVYEARLLAKTAREMGVVTQMGNQGHSSEGTRRINELIASGVIGKVHEVHVWTDRPVGYWAQGIPRPTNPNAPPAVVAVPSANATPAAAPPPPWPGPTPPRQWNQRTVDRATLAAMASTQQTPPPGLEWDLYLGAAQEIPYHPAYHPFSWRGWTDFGVGAIGDMGAHLIDQPFWALGLDYPTSISASSSPWGGNATNPSTYPMATLVQYEFAARGSQPPVKLYWYDGGLMPPRPAQLPDDVVLPRGDGGGGVFIGEKGILTYSTYGNEPKVYPEAIAKKAEHVPKTFARVDMPHEHNWIAACKGEVPVSSPFEYAAKLTETMLLGIVALKTGQGRKLYYDGVNMKVTNIPEANTYLTRVYRKGWEL